jgi:hypothetical protein
VGAHLLGALINAARAKNDQILDGKVVMDHAAYKFYPGLKDCHLRGISYWLVPNRIFSGALPMPSSNDLSQLERLFHATWKIELHGILSPIRPSGLQGKYWREVDVVYALGSEQLDCEDMAASGNG